MKTFLLVSAVILTGILGALMFPTVLFGVHLPDMGFLAWIYLVPLLAALSGSPAGQVFRASFSAGILLNLISLYWLVPAMVNFGGLSLAAAIGVLLVVVLALTAYFSLAMSSAAWSARRLNLPLGLVLPFLGKNTAAKRDHQNKNKGDKGSQTLAS